MFFSANDLYRACLSNSSLRWAVNNYYGLSDYTPVNRKQVAEYVRRCKAAILNRDRYVIDDVWVTKWLRPWDVVPSLVNYTAPEGEFAVGVEVEMGFNTIHHARAVAQKVKHWKHIALDYEGGNSPIEATFPPVLYSKFDGQTQASRYLKMLTKPGSGVVRHASDAVVGTHVNVSKGGSVVSSSRNASMWDALQDNFLTEQERVKYFGRAYPYNYNIDQGGYTEFKMFNSTTDWKRLRQYVDVAVALAELLHSDRYITQDSIRTALEDGYNKHNDKRKRVAAVSL